MISPFFQECQKIAASFHGTEILSFRSKGRPVVETTVHLQITFVTSLSLQVLEIKKQNCLSSE